MLIINQWGTSGAEYITDDIVSKDENIDGIDMSCLYVNGLCFAMSSNKYVIQDLQHDLHKFVDVSKRTTDTFDIHVEMNRIEKNHKLAVV